MSTSTSIRHRCSLLFWPIPLYLRLARPDCLIARFLGCIQWIRSRPFSVLLSKVEGHRFVDRRRLGAILVTLLFVAATPGQVVASEANVGSQELPEVKVYIVPGTHGTVTGWLVDFARERSYMLNNYLDHLNRVRDDATYTFALSEVPNLISFLDLAPDRFEELRQRVREKRVELVNGFFLEPTINLSGGEVLARMGIEGLRWQSQVFGSRPRFAWMIDVIGIHPQMSQIVSGLGLEALVYSRNNPTGQNIHWWESPDGSRTLAICVRRYAEWPLLFHARRGLSEREVNNLASDLKLKIEHNPAGAPTLLLVGAGDYSLAPAYGGHPGEFLVEWRKFMPDLPVRFAIPSDFLDALRRDMQQGHVLLNEFSGETAFGYGGFWISNPKVKQLYRKSEHSLQSAEMVATIASLSSAFRYPVQPLYNAWIQLLLNTDRGLLWGVGAGNAFKDQRAWDAQDRFNSIEAISTSTATQALRSLSLSCTAVPWCCSTPSTGGGAIPSRSDYRGIAV